ncbi:MAG: outer membrane protein (OmpH-like) [Firmicutes bacterium]|nr:outer membrane protein (OmpH-like) [Bacillota bacterium]
MRKKIVVSLFVVVIMAIGLVLGGCGTGSNVGVVDVEKVMNESPKAKGFRDQLSAKFNELNTQLEKDKASLSQDEFQKRQEAAYSDLVKLRTDLEGQIDTSMKQALDQVAQEKKFSVILYKNGVAQGGNDVTDAVIGKMQ